MFSTYLEGETDSSDSERIRENPGEIGRELSRAGPSLGAPRLVREEAVLVHHDDADAVVDVEHRRLGRVVRRAPPVAADRARRLRAEEVDARRHRHPDDGEVRVVAEAAYLV